MLCHARLYRSFQFSADFLPTKPAQNHPSPIKAASHQTGASSALLISSQSAEVPAHVLDVLAPVARLLLQLLVET